MHEKDTAVDQSVPEDLPRTRAGHQGLEARGGVVPAPLCRSLREYLIILSPLLTNNYTKHTNYQETELQPVTHQASPSG